MSIEVSVIIPVYNTEKYLKECLLSVRNQIYQDFEVIMVDDGSTDSSYEICCDFSRNDKRFRAIKNEFNIGPGGTRNNGLKYATGNYVIFLDSDDRFCRDTLLNLMAKTQGNSPDIIIGRMFWENGNVLRPVEYIENYYLGKLKSLYKNIRSLSVEDCSLGSICARLFSMSFIQKNNLAFVEGIVWEDVVFSYMSWYYAKTIYIDDTIVHLRTLRDDENNKSITQTITEKSFTDRNILLRAVYDFGVSHADDPYAVSLTKNVMGRIGKTTDVIYNTAISTVDVSEQFLNTWYEEYSKESQEMMENISSKV